MSGGGLHPSFSKPTDGVSVTSPLDAAVSALVAIDTAHHEIHEGDAYQSCATNEALADTNTLILVFKTPADHDIHLGGHINVKVAGRLKVWEGATWTQGTGTLNPAYNRNRNSSNVSNVLENRTAAAFQATGNVIKDPGGYSTAAAVAIHSESFLSPVARGGGTLRADSEWLLKRSTQYAVEFTAIGNSNGASLLLDWYEVAV